MRLSAALTLVFAISLSYGTAATKRLPPSPLWQSDLGNGRYRNPIIWADYSDPDVCRVGDDYYMVSSTFNLQPGLRILHSRDLVNWSLTGVAALPAYPTDGSGLPPHGRHVWAPAIRHHNGRFYIFWGDPDEGAYVVKADNIGGPWTEPLLLKSGKGIIDTAPLWDDDGHVYLVHAYAGSRAQFKSVLAICELDSAVTKATTPSRIVFDGHDNYPICEGPKFYKRDGWYYIFFPAGGVPAGWQAAGRSRSVYGPYEVRTVMHQGATAVNGPHQGAWVDTPKGEDWFVHFQRTGAYGRVVHLQPMKWKDGWPQIGVDTDGDGIGEPVAEYRKPDLSGSATRDYIQESDEFDGQTMSPCWQWPHPQDDRWAYCCADSGYLRLYSYPSVPSWHNLWDTPNLLLTSPTAPVETATCRMTFCPSTLLYGERAGLALMGFDYTALTLECRPDGLHLCLVQCCKADLGTSETTLADTLLIHASDSLLTSVPAIRYRQTVCLRVAISTDYSRVAESEAGVDLRVSAQYSYSIDGRYFTLVGPRVGMREGKSIGGRIALFCTRPAIKTIDGGWADVDWYRVTAPDNKR